MTGAAYTYRLRLTTEHGRVQAEVRDPQGNLLGEPSGQLRFVEPYRSLVESNSQKALQGKGDKYIRSTVPYSLRRCPANRFLNAL